MKIPEMKLGKPFTIATGVYIICSLFGCLLYMVLPPFFSSVGARIHTYMLLIAATAETNNAWLITGTVIAHLYVLVMLVLGVISMKTGRSKAFCLMNAAELLFTFAFLILRSSVTNEFTSGILVNLAYWIWLFRKTFPSRVHSSNE